MAKYTYVYSDGCSPCRAITPIIDTFIAVGYDVEKVNHTEYVKTNRNVPTPTLIDNNTEPNKMYGQELAPLAQLSMTHPQLLKKNLPEYLKEILTNNKKKVDK